MILRRIPAAVALIGVFAGCGGGGAATAPTPQAAVPDPPVATTPAAAAPTGGACADYDKTVSTVRGIADALRRGPVLPAGVDLFLLGPRAQAANPEDADPELVAARAELVAAIDDLDAQGRALLPPGGNAARDPVQLNPDRILAAAAVFERLCGGR
jgi:hypothetical protein